jgi:hypothetical protein
MKPEGLVESVRQRLLNLSRHNGEAFDFVLSRYGVERFLYRLSVSPEADRFVLKGAMLFHVWNQRMHRPTRDLDLLGFGADDVASVRGALLNVIRTHVPDDGLSFDEGVLRVEEIREEAFYGGVRAKMVARLGNVRIPLQIDVGFGDAVVPEPERRDYPVLLEGFASASLATYPARTVIAEKFEALVRLDAFNTRMKDFFDLHYLLDSEVREDERLLEAIEATFKRRGTAFPDHVPTGLTTAFAREKQPMWQAFLRKNGLQAPLLKDVVTSIRMKLPVQWAGEAI